MAADEDLKSILSVVLFCSLCRKPCELGDAIPSANDGTGFGCPIPDCGGILVDRLGAITPDMIRLVE